MPVCLYRFNLNHLFQFGKINRIMKIYAENTYSPPFLARRTKLNQETETAQASPFLFFHITQWNKKTWWQANADGDRLVMRSNGVLARVGWLLSRLVMKLASLCGRRVFPTVIFEFICYLPFLERLKFTSYQDYVERVMFGRFLNSRSKYRILYWK